MEKKRGLQSYLFHLLIPFRIGTLSFRSTIEILYIIECRQTISDLSVSSKTNKYNVSDE